MPRPSASLESSGTAADSALVSVLSKSSDLFVMQEASESVRQRHSDRGDYTHYSDSSS